MLLIEKGKPVKALCVVCRRIFKTWKWNCICDQWKKQFNRHNEKVWAEVRGHKAV
jgi:hypothetical protein